MIEEYVLKTQLSIPAKAIVEWAELHKKWNSAHSYWEARSKDFLLTMTEQGQEYPWHSDSHNTRGAKNSRLWTRILYLSPGSPIQFGEWKGTSYITDRQNSTVPIPEPILEIYPQPGLQIEFPSFFLHRVPTQESLQHRWTIVSFITYHPTLTHQTLYFTAFKEYMPSIFHSEL